MLTAFTRCRAGFIPLSRSRAVLKVSKCSFILPITQLSFLYVRCELVHPSTGLQFSFCLIYALITTGAALTGDTSRRRWGVCFGLVLISAAPPLPWSGLVPLVRSAVRCSFGVHRAPLPALVCFAERPAVRCCPLRFVLYACIVKRILYKVKRKIYKLLRFVKYV